MVGTTCRGRITLREKSFKTMCIHVWQVLDNVTCSQKITFWFHFISSGFSWLVQPYIIPGNLRVCGRVHPHTREITSWIMYTLNNWGRLYTFFCLNKLNTLFVQEVGSDWIKILARLIWPLSLRWFFYYAMGFCVYFVLIWT